MISDVKLCLTDPYEKFVPISTKIVPRLNKIDKVNAVALNSRA